MDDYVKKEKYECPVLEVTEFETEDIVTTSDLIPKDDYEGGGY